MPDTEKLVLDPDELTIGDLETFEEIAGRALDEVFDFEHGGSVRGALDAKTMLALVFVLKRKENPDYTLDEARTFKLSDLDVEGADPKGAEPAK